MAYIFKKYLPFIAKMFDEVVFQAVYVTYLDEPLTSPIEGFVTTRDKYRPDKCRMKPHWCSQQSARS